MGKYLHLRYNKKAGASHNGVTEETAIGELPCYQGEEESKEPLDAANESVLGGETRFMVSQLRNKRTGQQSGSGQ